MTPPKPVMKPQHPIRYKYIYKYQEEYALESAIIAQMLDYISTTLEQSHPVFGNLPVCPFARQARLSQQIRFIVSAFDRVSVTKANSEMMTAIDQFYQTPNLAVLMLIHPCPTAFSLSDFNQLLSELNDQLAFVGLVAFGGHPDDSFNVAGVFTRQDPFINLVVQSRTKLQSASAQLQKTQYYDRWSPENLEAISFHHSGDRKNGYKPRPSRTAFTP